MSDEQTEPRTIILGITESGKKFRPSDWAERMCGNLCTFRNRRIIYSPLLRPGVYEGVKSVIMSNQLSIQHPNMFKELLEFAKTNKLVVKEESITPA
ncbi:DUF3579 domain-containing protein [Kangiella marina]|uniref:Acetyltransferase n=1 Tax=Kangiella marina TaxID=1079178 RepID=A0ABP8IQC8_9GAMM